MLNHGTRISGAAAKRRDITGESEWICRRGHSTTVWLSFDGERTIGGSAWDFCDQCDCHPNPVQHIEMQLDIYGQWLEQESITIGEYRALTHEAVGPGYGPGDPAETILGLPYRPEREERLRDIRCGAPDQPVGEQDGTGPERKDNR